MTRHFAWPSVVVGTGVDPVTFRFGRRGTSPVAPTVTVGPPDQWRHRIPSCPPASVVCPRRRWLDLFNHGVQRLDRIMELVDRELPLRVSPVLL
jgi:hypothetical protein